MKCRVRRVKQGLCMCPICHRRWDVDDPKLVPVESIPDCDPSKVDPSYLQQAANLSEAEIKYQLAGRPKRTVEEVEAILIICQSNKCGLYQRVDDDNGYCRHISCGCPISRVAKHRNKALWATEKCPEGYW